MGRDKAELVVAGERLADRAARVLQTVCDPVLEIGTGHSVLETGAADLVDRGEPAMHALLSAVPVVEISEPEWRTVAPADALTDLDTPDDLARHGIDDR